MALFDLKELNPGAWFDYPDGGKVCIRPITPGIIESIREKAVTYHVEYKKHGRSGQYQRFEVEKTDDKLIEKEVWDYTIVNWEGFTTSKGNLQCNKENKVKLMLEHPTFYKFVDSCVSKLNEDEAAEAKESEKNSETLPNG